MSVDRAQKPSERRTTEITEERTKVEFAEVSKTGARTIPTRTTVPLLGKVGGGEISRVG